MSKIFGYGEHPTKFGNLSNDELFSMFTQNNWNNLNEESKQQLLQETVNRQASYNGEIGSCKVIFDDLGNGTYGSQSGNVIRLNRNIFVDGVMKETYNGHEIEYLVNHSNFLALETVLHEDIHAWQNQVTKGDIKCNDPSLVYEYASNNFTVSYVNDKDGQIKTGSHYLNNPNNTEIGYLLYYFQSTERDAHYYSQERTMAIMDRLEEKYGKDFSMDAYKKEIDVNGFYATFDRGEKIFGNTDFSKDLNQVLMNQYYGTSQTVNSNMENIVKSEMIDSYQDQQRNSQIHEENIQMDPVENREEQTDIQNSMENENGFELDLE